MKQLNCSYFLPISCQKAFKVRSRSPIQVMLLSDHSFTLIDLTFPYSASGWNMSYYLWGVFRVRRKDSNLPYHVPTRKHCNFNGNLLAVGRRTHAHASSGPSFYYSPTCEDSPSIMPLEANHEGCPNGENSLG